MIILLSITAITTIGILLKKTSNQILTSPEFSCFDIKIEPLIKIEKNCYDSQTKELRIEIERTLKKREIKIDSLGFVVDYEADKKTDNFLCADSCSNCETLTQGRKIYYFGLEQKPKKVIIKINNCVVETKEVSEC